jgi:hypothetical protein
MEVRRCIFCSALVVWGNDVFPCICDTCDDGTGPFSPGQVEILRS